MKRECQEHWPGCGKLFFLFLCHLGNLREAFDAPLSMGFSMQKYWNALPFPPPEDLPHPGIKPKSLAL